MIFWLATATLTALLTVWVVTPLMRENNTIAGWLLVALLPAAALILYAVLGAPGFID